MPLTSPGTTGTRPLGGLCGAQRSPTSERISNAQGAHLCVVSAAPTPVSRPQEVWRPVHESPLICPGQDRTGQRQCRAAMETARLHVPGPRTARSYPWKASAAARSHRELSTCTASWHPGRGVSSGGGPRWGEGSHRPAGSKGCICLADPHPRQGMQEALTTAWRMGG